MKRILLIVLCFNAVSGFSQASQAGTNLENDFVNTTLEAKHIEAFENRAKQKVRDFCNYIQLISDKTYDEKLRVHSKKMALALFNSTDCTIVDSLITGNNEQCLIERYVNQLANTDYHKIIGIASNISLASDLQLMESGDYLGTISYNQELNCYDSKDQLLNTQTEKKEVAVTLSRKTKSFGNQEKIIWVVNLCDIKDVE